jgi:Tol biopolymer transport system component
MRPSYLFEVMSWRGLVVVAVMGALATVAAVPAWAGPSFASAVQATGLVGGQAPAWSSDGSEIAYIGPGPYEHFVGETLTDEDNLNHVFVVPADGSVAPKSVVTAPKGDTLDAVSFGPGGSFVYQDSNYTLWLAMPGRKPSRVATVGVAGRSGIAYALSPDGRMVAFDAPCGCKLAQADAIETRALAGGKVRRLSRFPAVDPSFSPDSTHVVFSGADGSVVIEPAAGGASRSLGVDGEEPEWSPNGHWIAFLGKNDAFQIVTVTGGTPKTLIRGDVYPKGVVTYSWAPDSSELVWLTGTTLGTVDLNGKTTTFSLPGLRVGGEGVPQFSPDGSSIAFTARALKTTDPNPDIRIYVIGANGKGLRRVA